MTDATDVMIRYNELKRNAAEIEDPQQRGEWIVKEMEKFTHSELVEICKHTYMAHEFAMI